MVCFLYKWHLHVDNSDEEGPLYMPILLHVVFYSAQPHTFNVILFNTCTINMYVANFTCLAYAISMLLRLLRPCMLTGSTAKL